MLLINFGFPLVSIFSFLEGGSLPESGPDTITDVGTHDCCCCCMSLLGDLSLASPLVRVADTELEFETFIVRPVLCAEVGAATVCTA